MISFYSRSNDINNRPSLLKLHLFCKQISLIWLSSVLKNQNDFRKKTLRFSRNYNMHSWVLDLVLLTSLRFLLLTCKLDWILNFSSFLIWQHISKLQFSIFSHSLTWNRSGFFPEILQTECVRLDINNCREITTIAHI